MIVESFKGGNKKERKKERLFKGYKGETKKRKTVQWLEMKKQKRDALLTSSLCHPRNTNHPFFLGNNA